MQAFKDYIYKRPQMKEVEANFNQLLTEFELAPSVTVQGDLIKKINALRNDFETMVTLVQIRHSIDTTDEFYEQENDYLDEVMPLYEGLVNKYYQSLVTSKFRPELEKRWGAQLFRIADLKLKTFSPAIIPALQSENKLVSKYRKLRASAKIMFEGEERNLSQLEPFMESTDRLLRQRAHQAFSDFFAAHEEEFDGIYDQLVKMRDAIARQLGFTNFIDLGYARLSRSDYNQEMVAGYREQILKVVVPAATRLRQRQAKRLNVKSLKYYDESLTFASGNPVPKGGPGQILQNAARMYEELSPETGEFFRYMVERELMDLVTKQGKAGGGFCAYINNYQAPFIFANFNGSAGDVDVLTHEAGHAFQVYSSRGYEVPEYIWPTLEACEIHSMSMEFFAWPWMHLFFAAEEKYKFAHLSNALLFLAYGATVDEFQHWVYANPQASPLERKRKWREIEMKYLPHRDYGDNAFLQAGGYWFRQGHIFSDPFYYIDYTLAQICAFQFWAKYRNSPRQAWQDYLRLCTAGGSKSFLELVEIAGLANPFKDGTIQTTLQPVLEWLDQVDQEDFS
ncbi:MAG TPA: M3 family oligoendopeptidase [Bacillota bacterium]